MGFPVYVATADLDGVKVSLRTGQPFPIQSKPFIRGLGTAYGVADAMTVPFGDLPYVTAIDAGSFLKARQMVQGLVPTPSVTPVSRAKRRKAANG